MKINSKQINEIIAMEAASFKKRLIKNTFAREVVGVALESIVEITQSTENSEGYKTTLMKDLQSDTFDRIPAASRIHEALETGDVETSFATSIASIAHKYGSMESEYRANSLKIDYRDATLEYDRSEIIKTVTEAFESLDMNLDISEALNEEVGIVRATEGADIVSDVVKDVKDAIIDADEKSEVINTIVKEFTETRATIEDRAEAVGANITEESLSFDVAGTIRKTFPSTGARFALADQTGGLSVESIHDCIIMIERNRNPIEAIKETENISKRVNAIRRDMENDVTSDMTKLDAFEKRVNGVVDKYKKSIIASKLLGIGRNGASASIHDSASVLLSQEFWKFLAEESDTRAINLNSIIMKDAEEITSVESFITVAMEHYRLKTAPTTHLEGASFESYEAAIDIRNENLAEFLLSNDNDRLVKIKAGLAQLANNGIGDFTTADHMKSTYYKTVQASDAGEVPTLGSAASALKALIKDNYGTDKYAGIVDTYFNGNSETRVVSEENLYEFFTYSTAMNLHSNESSMEEIAAQGDKIKETSKVFTAYTKTLESINMITHNDIKRMVAGIK